MKIVNFKVISKKDQTESLDDNIELKTLITSKDNSVGKSTYMRLLAYSLGYNVPALKNLDFSTLILTTTIILDSGETIKIERDNNSIKIIHQTLNEEIFILPFDFSDFLKRIFGDFDLRILNNLFGIIYIDQEKGWGLLNRGSVIGRVKFSIEELLCGLNDINCDEEINKKNYYSTMQLRLKSMLELDKVQKEIYDSNDLIDSTETEEEILSKISLYKLNVSKINKKIKELDDRLNSEEKFFKFIENLNIRVNSPSGPIEVNRNNIEFSSESQILLESRKSLLENELYEEKRKLDLANLALEDYYKNQGLLADINSETKKMYSDILKTNINLVRVTELLESSESELKIINKNLKDKISVNNKYITEIYEKVAYYVDYFKLKKQIVYKEDFIFTHDIKSLSGANLHLLSFCFKLAFLKVVQNKIGINLPMFIDSPRGKELDDTNFTNLIRLINEELKDNQIIFASMCDIDDTYKIFLENKTLELRQKK